MLNKIKVDESFINIFKNNFSLNFSILRELYPQIVKILEAEEEPFQFEIFKAEDNGYYIKG